MINKEKIKRLIKECLKSKFNEKVDAWDLLDINVALQNAVDDMEAWNDADFAPEHEDYILLSFANSYYPCIGWCKKYLDGSSSYMLLTNETCLEKELIVNGWMELPKRKED